MYLWPDNTSSYLWLIKNFGGRYPVPCLVLGPFLHILAMAEGTLCLIWSLIFPSTFWWWWKVPCVSFGLWSCPPHFGDGRSYPVSRFVLDLSLHILVIAEGTLCLVMVLGLSLHILVMVEGTFCLVMVFPSTPTMVQNSCSCNHSVQTVETSP
jgi:hypothetical protein